MGAGSYQKCSFSREMGRCFPPPCLPALAWKQAQPRHHAFVPTRSLTNDEAGLPPPGLDHPGSVWPVRPARLSELLVHVAETGSLWQAARQLATEGLFLAAP